MEENLFSTSNIESYRSSNPDVSIAAGQDIGAFGSSLTGLVVFSFSSSKILAKELLTNWRRLRLSDANDFWVRTRRLDMNVARLESLVDVDDDKEAGAVANRWGGSLERGRSDRFAARRPPLELRRRPPEGR